MFKRIKDSGLYQKYKDLRRDSQSSARMSLIIWMIFFLIVILFARNINKSTYDVRVDNYSNDNLRSYEFAYVNDKNTIFGKMYGGKLIFYLLNEKYYYDGSNVYKIQNHSLNSVSNFDLDVLKITPNMINDLISDVNPVKKDGLEKFYISLSKFISLYDIDNDVDLSKTTSYNIIVNKYYNDDSLYMIKVDLSNYYLYKNLQNDGILTINLYEQNKINDFTREYDKMIGVIK